MNGRAPRRILALLAVAMLATSASAAAADPGGADQKFITTGDRASVSWWSSSGENGWLYVSRNEGRDRPDFAHLQYFVQRGATVEAGSGMIPASAFTGETNTGLSLTIDTSTLAAPFMRTSGAGGAIAISWVRTNSHRAIFSGKQENSFVTPWGATITFRLIGTRHSFSAAATGTVFGGPPTGMSQWAEVGRDHQVQFTYIEE